MRQIMFGEAFDVEVEIEEEDVEPAINEKNKKPAKVSERIVVASAVFASAMTFLGGAAILGVLTSNFSALQAVWAVASVPVSSILTFYFTRT